MVTNKEKNEGHCLLKKSGFSLIEMLIVVFIISIFVVVVIVSTRKIVEREQARECSGSLVMLYSAVNNYCLDNNLVYGSVVMMTNLIASGHLMSTETYVCPASKDPYQSTFTNGVIPVCPSGITGHICKP